MSGSSRTIALSLGLSAIVTFLASLCELIVAGVVQHRLIASRKLNLDGNGEWISAGTTGVSLPPHIIQLKTLVASFSAGEIAVAVLSLILSLAALAWSLSSLRRSSQPARGVWLTVLMVFAFAVTIVNAGIFGWVFSVSDTQGPAYFGDASPQSGGGLEISWGDTITWERYLCTVAPVVRGFEGGHWYASTCNFNVSSSRIPLLF